MQASVEVTQRHGVTLQPALHRLVHPAHATARTERVVPAKTGSLSRAVGVGDGAECASLRANPQRRCRNSLAVLLVVSAYLDKGTVVCTRVGNKLRYQSKRAARIDCKAGSWPKEGLVTQAVCLKITCQASVIQ